MLASCSGINRDDLVRRQVHGGGTLPQLVRRARDPSRGPIIWPARLRSTMQTPRNEDRRRTRGRAPIAHLRVKGWARTVRASKKVVFIELNDGSSFGSLQVVAGERAGELRRAQPRDHRLGAEHRRRADRLARQGPARGAQGDQSRDRGQGRPELSAAEEAPRLRIPARASAPSRAHQHVWRGVSRAQRAGAGDPSLLRRARVRLCPHADHHGQRCRGRGRDVSRHDAAGRQPAAHAGMGRSTTIRTSSPNPRT